MLLCPSRSETEAAAESELSVGCPLVCAIAVAAGKPPAQRLQSTVATVPAIATGTEPNPLRLTVEQFEAAEAIRVVQPTWASAGVTLRPTSARALQTCELLEGSLSFAAAAGAECPHRAL